MIELRNLTKTFPGGVRALRDVSFSVGRGEFVVLIGLSGCGKTTALKTINRLVKPDSGTIAIDDVRSAEWDEISLRRNIGYVIQDVGLLPHLTVAQNVAIVPRLRGWKGDRIKEKVERMLAMVNLDPATFGDRYPHELSGGQQQRIGVARALAGDPEIVLMDEPFGALDPITREELQDEFLKLQQQIHKTIVFVTHDIFEAVKMGNRIAVMKDGVVEQIDTVEGIIENPASEFVRSFLGRHRDYLARFAEEMASQKAQP